MDNNTILLGILILFLIYYYQTSEAFENAENMKKNKECSRLSVNNAIYGYRVNMINRGAR